MSPLHLAIYSLIPSNLLRNVIPYAHSPSVRKLSKIATLLLAKNYILMQTNALEEMRKLVAYLSHSAGIPVPPLGLPPPPSPPFSLASSVSEATRLPSSLFPRLSMPPPPGLHFPPVSSSAAASLLSQSSSPHLSLGIHHHHHVADPPSLVQQESKRHNGGGSHL